jgi:8-oxo-dGTP pyrophosphatase MutT (NUDIX family)
VAARRELQEETGFTAEEFILVNKTARNSTNSEVVDYVFLAKNASHTHETAFDENELCETLLVSPSQVLEMLRRGEIVDLGNVAALYRVLDYLGVLGN